MRAKGQQTEQIAAQYLSNQGLSLRCSNFYCRGGEIDLIMTQHGTLVFVEVKYRQKTDFGRAAEAVSYTKQQKIKKCAAFYLQQQGLNEYNTECRFDVVGIEGDLNRPQITWLKNAF